MKTIILACAAGMSTSLLVTKMEKAATDQGLELKIFAIPEGKVSDEIQNTQDEVKAILLGPQVKYMENDFKTKFEPLGIHVGVINMIDYGMMDGAKVLASVLEKI